MKHVIRFRNKRGYGVHSPFMFNMIMNVIRDRRHNYQYPVIAEQMRMSSRRRKYLRLLYRLRQFFKADVFCVFGNVNNQVEKYVGSVNGMESLSEATMVVIDGEVPLNVDIAIKNVMGTRKQCIVILDIYRKQANYNLWQQLKENSKVQIDMMWYGVLIFDEKIQVGKYTLKL